MSTLYILNAAVVTNYGVFSYKPMTLDVVKMKLADGFVNAIGHESTARLFSEITGIQVTPNRIQVKMQVGDEAIVFWANQRLPEGYVVKTIDELKAIGFTFGLLTMEAGAPT